MNKIFIENNNYKKPLIQMLLEQKLFSQFVTLNIEKKDDYF